MRERESKKGVRMKEPDESRNETKKQNKFTPTDSFVNSKFSINDDDKHHRE